MSDGLFDNQVPAECYTRVVQLDLIFPELCKSSLILKLCSQNCCADGYSFIRVDPVGKLLSKEVLKDLLNLWDSRCATDEDDLVNLWPFNLSVFKNLLDWIENFHEEVS